MRREALHLIPHTRQCVARGCYRRIPLTEWFCKAHEVSGLEQAKSEITAALERRALQQWMASNGLMYVYALGCEDRVKFGRTRNLRKRVMSISTQSPFKVELISAILSGSDLEGRIHKYLAADRLHGEWFTRSPSVERVLNLFDADDDQPLRELLAS